MTCNYYYSDELEVLVVACLIAIKAFSNGNSNLQ